MKLIPVFLAALLVLAGLTFGTPSQVSAQTATCKGSVGPGIPAPTNPPAGIPGFHATWYGQSGYMFLCPGEKATATVAYYNSGSLGWVQGRMGESAYLGTWGPEPGQDSPSLLGGLRTGWPRDNRIAVQPASYVGPGQVAWFQFTVQAPMSPGSYRLYLRPLIEGATWMEDYGVYWSVEVLTEKGERLGLPGCSNWPADLTLMLAYLPVRAGLCLVRDLPSSLTICVSGATGCYFGRINLIWVDRAVLGEEFTFTTAHEICHAHQSYELNKRPVTGWEFTDEGQEFKTSWDLFRVQHPSAFYRELGNYVENFADACAGWYVPVSWAVDTSKYAPLRNFSLKWLPK